MYPWRREMCPGAQERTTSRLYQHAQLQVYFNQVKRPDGIINLILVYYGIYTYS